MEDLKVYLETIENENTRKAAATVLKKLDKYIELTNEAMDEKIERVYQINNYDLEAFVKSISVNKSNTSILNTVAILKKLFKFYDNEEATADLNLNYIRSLIDVRKTQLLTPHEVYNGICNVANYQEKALILLIYMGLYDKQFKTIRNIKGSDIDTKNHKLNLEDGRVIELNEFCLPILFAASKEEKMVKYSDKSESYTTPYELADSEYLFKTKARKGGNAGAIGVSSLVKRLESIARVLEDDRFTAVNIKQSRIVYDMVKLEFEQNLGEDINQLYLGEYLKENNISGTVGNLNMYKKELKNKIIEQIVKGQTRFIDRDC